MQNGKLRVGVMIDSYMLPAWAHLMLQKVVMGDYADVVLVIVNEEVPERPNVADSGLAAWKTRAANLVSGFLRNAQNLLLERDFTGNAACELVDTRPLLNAAAAITVSPTRSEVSDRFAAADIQAIRSHNIDILIRLGFRFLEGDILTASRYGVWSYHFGDNRINRGGPPGFWETMESWPETGTVLQILSEDLNGGTVVYRSWSCTDGTSVRMNNNSRYWTAASFLPRALQRLYETGAETFFGDVARRNQHPEIYCGRLFAEPGNGTLFLLLCRKTWQKIRRKVSNKFYFNQWILLFDFNRFASISLRRFKRIVPSRDRFWADPFVMYRDGSYFVFFEEFTYARQKGHISVLQMDGDGRHEAPVTIVEEPHHLSYPFLVDHAGSTYMVAEAVESKSVPLYRCEEFPHKWVHVGNLLEDIAALDSTLYYRDGTWFLFVGVAENPGSSTWDELFLYYSRDLLGGRWTPHPLNPIVSDVRSARPAGRLVEHGGNLYRPNQNSSHHYGYGLNFSLIKTLSETEYEEEVVSRIEPKWSRDIVSIHTYSTDGDLTLVDGQLRRARFW